MEWIEVFVATSQIGLEPVEGVLYQCGLCLLYTSPSPRDVP